jgi:hypothetical protein
MKTDPNCIETTWIKSLVQRKHAQICLSVQFIKYEIMTPMATMIWNIPVMRPRTCVGEHSLT